MKIAFLRILVLVLTTLASPTPAKDQPNIVFIMSDDHGFQAISAYGSNRNSTPNIDRIAKDGALLDRFFVGNSICAPSRATMLTGLHSHANGLTDNRRPFNAAQRHVVRMLQSAGYQTGLIGKWHLEGEPTGFDHYDRLISQGEYYNPRFRLRSSDHTDGFTTAQQTGYVTDLITEKSIDWLKHGRDPGRPFMLCVHHKAPHRDWSPALRHLDLYDDAPLPEPPTLFDDWDGKGPAAHTQEMTISRDLSVRDLKLRPPRRLTDGQRRVWDSVYGPKNDTFREMNLEGDLLTKWKYQRYVKDYLRCIASVDEGVGRILDTLADLDLDDNTIVIYTSDQGWYLGEHGWFDKRWMYEESFRTPFIIRWPRQIRAGTKVSSLTQNIDIAPTLLDAAGVGVPSDMHGVSMLPVLNGEEPEGWRQSVYYRYYEYPGWHSVQRHEGVRTKRHKLMHFYQLGVYELYDLDLDPDEMNNVIDDVAYAPVATQLRAELAALKAKYHVPAGEHYQPPADGRRE
ncbi:MAG: sulfatase [Planctomycetota bacterium]